MKKLLLDIVNKTIRTDFKNEIKALFSSSSFIL
jgi:hypothetical protein